MLVGGGAIRQVAVVGRMFARVQGVYLIFDLQIKFRGSNQGVQSNIANYVELGVIKPSLTLFRIDIYF